MSWGRNVTTSFRKVVLSKDGQNSQRKWMAPPKESGYTIEGSVAEDFLGGPIAKTLCSHCRGHRFSLWSGS